MRFDLNEVKLLGESLAMADAEAGTLRAELAAAQEALVVKDAEIAELAKDILPPPPTTEMHAAPPLYAAADFGDQHVEIPLDQYLSELFTTLMDDSKALEFEALLTLGVLYDLNRELLLQGTVGVSPATASRNGTLSTSTKTSSSTASW